MLSTGVIRANKQLRSLSVGSVIICFHSYGINGSVRNETTSSRRKFHDMRGWGGTSTHLEFSIQGSPGTSLAIDPIKSGVTGDQLHSWFRALRVWSGSTASMAMQELVGNSDCGLTLLRLQLSSPCPTSFPADWCPLSSPAALKSHLGILWLPQIRRAHRLYPCCFSKHHVCSSRRLQTTPPSPVFIWLWKFYFRYWISASLQWQVNMEHAKCWVPLPYLNLMAKL